MLLLTYDSGTQKISFEINCRIECHYIVIIGVKQGRLDGTGTYF